jgi:hypothetical protein
MSAVFPERNAWNPQTALVKEGGWIHVFRMLRAVNSAFRRRSCDFGEKPLQLGETHRAVEIIAGEHGLGTAGGVETSK